MHVDDGIMTGGSAHWEKCMRNLFGKLRLRHHRISDFEHLKRQLVRRKDGSIDVRSDNVAAIKLMLVAKEKRIIENPAGSRTFVDSPLANLAHHSHTTVAQCAY